MPQPAEITLDAAASSTDEDLQDFLEYVERALNSRSAAARRVRACLVAMVRAAEQEEFEREIESGRWKG